MDSTIVSVFVFCPSNPPRQSAHKPHPQQPPPPEPLPTTTSPLSLPSRQPPALDVTTQQQRCQSPSPLLPSQSLPPLTTANTATSASPTATVQTIPCPFLPPSLLPPPPLSPLDPTSQITVVFLGARPAPTPEPGPNHHPSPTLPNSILPTNPPHHHRGLRVQPRRQPHPLASPSRPSTHGPRLQPTPSPTLDSLSGRPPPPLSSSTQPQLSPQTPSTSSTTKPFSTPWPVAYLPSSNPARTPPRPSCRRVPSPNIASSIPRLSHTRIRTLPTPQIPPHLLQPAPRLRHNTPTLQYVYKYSWNLIRHTRSLLLSSIAANVHTLSTQVLHNPLNRSRLPVLTPPPPNSATNNQLVLRSEWYTTLSTSPTTV